MKGDHGMIVLATAVACLVVLLGWVAAAALAIVFMNRRVRRLEAQAPRESNELSLLFYAGSIFFWPASLVCTILFLREARTAHQGRVCGILGLLHISAIVVLTCAGMFALVVYQPGWLP